MRVFQFLLFTAMSCFTQILFAEFLVTLPADNNREINDQTEKSIQFLLHNIYRSDVAAGAVIAAPSTSHPNYFYHWVRDGALSANVIMDLEPQNPVLRSWLLSHVRFLETSRASALKDGQGLGEPKFNVDGTVFTGPWGRPQDDGPALRATALIRLYVLAQSEGWSEFSTLRTELYNNEFPATSLIKSDLEYVAQHWTENCFDLWEETIGYHFYTLMAERRAMYLGSELAQSLGDSGAASYYDSQYRLISQDLLRFWDSTNNFIPASLPSHGLRTQVPTFNTKSGEDTAVLLGLIHSDLEDGFISFSSDHVLSTYETLRSHFASIYAVNGDGAKNLGLGVALGRYPEDQYDGYDTGRTGNPWVLSTLSGAELLYRAAKELMNLTAPLVVSPVNIRILQRVLSPEALSLNQSFSPKSSEVLALVHGFINEADSLMERVIYHRNADGSLSEQINRDNGFMQGAPNLSWSHAAFITAAEARAQLSKTLFLQK